MCKGWQVVLKGGGMCLPELKPCVYSQDVVECDVWGVFVVAVPPLQGSKIGVQMMMLYAHYW